jgi:hypothetical protein
LVTSASWLISERPVSGADLISPPDPLRTLQRGHEHCIDGPWGLRMLKNFKLKPEQIAPVALGRGGGLATDRIVVDGEPVGYMFRERPANAQDSGWRFFAGDEDNTYMRNNQNHGVYDVNTVVNYDPDIFPFLDAAEGSRFERVGSTFRLLADHE